MAGKTRVFGPQPGPQEAFLATPADIAIYGGAAGGGKSWGLLAEPIRHIGNNGFGAVIFRRTSPQIKNEGALWDESLSVYRPLGSNPVAHVMQHVFPSGAKVTMAHLEHDKTVHNYQGSQIPLICFDELTHFTAKQFWYMLSRNRSLCGVRPYIRASTNPDADSWVAQFIAWWIDQDTGYPIPERSGVLRWFVRVGDTLIWGDTPEELQGHTDPDGEPIPPKSVTFISARLTDNQILMQADPGYMASLLALPTVERERLLGGNWKIRPAAGLYFQRTWCEIVDAAPSNLTLCRGWDFAGTPKTETNDPDATAGTLIGKSPDGRFFVMDHRKDFVGPHGVKTMVRNTAIADTRRVRIDIPQDPGSAGKDQVLGMTQMLAGFNVRSAPVTGSKITRFSGFSAQAEAGNVYVLRGAWNDAWFDSLEGFPDATHDDDVDSTSQAFNALVANAGYDMIAAVG